MYEVDSYKGYDFNMWTLVASTCFISVLYFWIDTRFGYWHTVVFHIFWMEWVRLASILLLPRLWHKARGRYPSPAVRVRFSTQFISFLVVCLLMYHNLAIIPIWRTTPPFLVPNETGENSTLANAKMEWTCWVFLAYLIHDTFHMLMTWKFTKLKSMLLHHISFGIVSFIGAEIFGRPGYHSDTEVVTEIVTEITYILQLTDSSTIFLNARWIVAVVLCNGKPKSIFAKLSLAACSILFSALYLVFRIFLMGSVLHYISYYNRTLQQQQMCCLSRTVMFYCYVLRCSILAAYLLNWYWLISGFKSKNSKSKEKAKHL